MIFNTHYENSKSDVAKHWAELCRSRLMFAVTMEHRRTQPEHSTLCRCTSVSGEPSCSVGSIRIDASV